MTLLQRILAGRRYRLIYGDRDDEYVTAIGPTEAVQYREGGLHSQRPLGITDETAVKEWVAGMQRRAFEAMVSGEAQRQEHDERRRRNDNEPRYLPPVKGRKKQR